MELNDNTNQNKNNQALDKHTNAKIVNKKYVKNQIILINKGDFLG